MLITSLLAIPPDSVPTDGSMVGPICGGGSVGCGDESVPQIGSSDPGAARSPRSSRRRSVVHEAHLDTALVYILLTAH